LTISNDFRRTSVGNSSPTTSSVGGWCMWWPIIVSNGLTVSLFLRSRRFFVSPARIETNANHSHECRCILIFWPIVF
jgi:hypothetical protein